MFLGFLLNTKEETILIPIEKIEKLRGQLLDLCSRKKTTILKFKQMTGLMNFICRAIVPGRAFTRRFYAKFANPKLKAHYHIEVDSEMKLDASVWLQFLETLNSSALCRPFVDFLKTLFADQIEFLTDALGAKNLGFGCFFRGCWTYGQWEPQLIELLKTSIEYLELYGCCYSPLGN